MARKGLRDGSVPGACVGLLVHLCGAVGPTQILNCSWASQSSISLPTTESAKQLQYQACWRLKTGLKWSNSRMVQLWRWVKRCYLCPNCTINGICQTAILSVLTPSYCMASDSLKCNTLETTLFHKKIVCK